MALNNPYAAYQKIASQQQVSRPKEQGEKAQSDVSLELSANLNPKTENLSAKQAPVGQDFSKRHYNAAYGSYANMSLTKRQLEQGGKSQEKISPLPQMLPANAVQEPYDKPEDQQQRKPTDKYLENKVMTASPEELTLMLYDGAIKFMTQAMGFLDAEKPDQAHYALIKTQDIFSEFMITLKLEHEISKDLLGIYAIIKENLVKANLNKDKELIKEILSLTGELRVTWAEAMQAAKDKQQAM